MLPKTNVNVKTYDGQTEQMYFLIEDLELLQKYSTIWDKVSFDIKKEPNSKSVCNKYFLKTKIKSYGDEGRDFHNNEILKLGSNHTCLAVVNANSAF